MARQELPKPTDGELAILRVLRDRGPSTVRDVTEALPAACRKALIKATEEMGDRATFKGYGPEQGYAFLREAIAKHDFVARGANVSADEIFVSDGSKCDCGNILDIFSHENQIAVIG